MKTDDICVMLQYVLSEENKTMEGLKKRLPSYSEEEIRDELNKILENMETIV